MATKTKAKKKKAKTTALAVKESYSITNPKQMVAMAKVLKDYIIKNNLSVKIVNRDYVMVEGWQFAGGLLGSFPRIASVENLSTAQEVKWQARGGVVKVRSVKQIHTCVA